MNATYLMRHSNTLIMNDARVANRARARFVPRPAPRPRVRGRVLDVEQVVDQFVLRLLVLPDASWCLRKARLVDLALAQGVDERGFVVASGGCSGGRAMAGASMSSMAGRHLRFTTCASSYLRRAAFFEQCVREL